MKKLKILALTTIITLIIFIVGAAVFAYLGVFSFNIGEEGGIGGLILNPAESEKENILRWRLHSEYLQESSLLLGTVDWPVQWNEARRNLPVTLQGCV